MSNPTCVFCKRSGTGVQFAVFNPRFKPFGTACVECEESLPDGTTVPEAKPEPAKAGKWQACPTNPPGRIQVGRFNKAHGALSSEHNSVREKWGVIGGEEHEMCFLRMFGGGRRDDVAAVQVAIGEKHGWTVSKANVNQVLADFEAAMPALTASRPVDDKRKTKEQSDAEESEARAAIQAVANRRERFAGTDPSFQATITRIASAARKTGDYVYELWLEYSKECSDQSAILHEFVSWKQKQLGATVEALRAALVEPVRIAEKAEEGGALGTVARNLAHDGVEIAFTDKPGDALRSTLKAAGFRITRRPPWKWYQKFSASAWAKACEIAGVSATPTEKDDPAGGYVQAQENAYQDAQAAAIGA